MREISEIILHCSATPPGRDIGVAEIDTWHKQRGWSGCGYHFVITRAGEIQPGRPVEKVGAHCKGHNAHSIGICLVGGVSDDGSADSNFTAAQYRSLLTLIKNLKNLYPDIKLAGHRDYSSKACPCIDIEAFMEAA